jgi:hypothetical protein
VGQARRGTGVVVHGAGDVDHQGHVQAVGVLPNGVGRHVNRFETQDPEKGQVHALCPADHQMVVVTGRVGTVPLIGKGPAQVETLRVLIIAVEIEVFHHTVVGGAFVGQFLSARQRCRIHRPAQSYLLHVHQSQVHGQAYRRQEGDDEKGDDDQALASLPIAHGNKVPESPGDRSRFFYHHEPPQAAGWSAVVVSMAGAITVWCWPSASQRFAGLTTHISRRRCG